jgi:hypothetical protein
MASSADTYVRDKAIQILVEKGLLSPVPNAPVDWTFGFWGRLDRSNIVSFG